MEEGKREQRQKQGRRISWRREIREQRQKQGRRISWRRGGIRKQIQKQGRRFPDMDICVSRGAQIQERESFSPGCVDWGGLFCEWVHEHVNTLPWTHKKYHCRPSKIFLPILINLSHFWHVLFFLHTCDESAVRKPAKDTHFNQFNQKII
jgi:hypothetical protein